MAEVRTVETSSPQFSVAGIGASAGGIQALQTLFASLPAARSVAFVVVQHQPEQPSHLARLFRAWTPMTVSEALDGVAMEPGCVYIAPPGRVLGLDRGAFTTRPLDRSSAHVGIVTIDSFFESLADHAGARAIAVVLSGAGSDGAAGAVRIKQAGGVVLVQDPTTAMHDSMPNAVIAHGTADHILPLRALGQELIACASPGYVRSSSAGGWAEEVTKALDGMVEVIRAKAGFDLTGYRTTPLLWRIQHRMQVRRVPRFRDYEALLRDDPIELETLVRGMPIHVTEFFRDPPAWSLLEREVLPDLFGATPDAPVRAWTPACATGEEAYSLAMLLAERAAANANDFQVFATDASPEIVARAGRGIFKAAAVNALAGERRQRFFDAADGSHRVKRALREKMLFAPQDLLADPPFNGLDLITCRNLLTSLEPDAARRVIHLLHSALRMGGILFLGKSESLSLKQGGFEELAPGSHVYRKTGRTTGEPFALPRRPSGSGRSAVEARSLAAAFAERDAPAVLIDDHFQIVRVYGDTGAFLQLRPGEPTLNVLQLSPPAITTALQLAVHEALARRQAVTLGGLADPVTGEPTLRIQVAPLQAPDEDGARLLVSFLRSGASAGGTTPDPGVPARGDSRSTELDWSEALRLSHEELASSREELQVLNEELRASNDQVNLGNEELNHANARLRDKLAELETQSNVLSSGAVMSLFLDEELRIRFYTPGVSELFPVRAGDIGRRITDLVQKFESHSFIDHVRAVMRTGEPCEAEVRTVDGRWYLKRIRPFRTGGGQAVGAGVAITFTDITDRRSAEDALRESNDRVSKLVALIPAGVYTCDAEGYVTYYNQRATELWGREPALGDVHERFCGALRMWTADGAPVPHDQCPMADAVRRGRPARNVEVVIEQPSGKRIVASVNIDPLHDREGRLAGAISVFVDVTDRRQAEEEGRTSAAALATELEAMTRLRAFSAAAGDTHDVEDLLEAALDTIMRLHGADMGNIQLYDPESAVLWIAAHRGFDRWFLDHFAEVDASEATACARAMALRERVVFDDVEACTDRSYRDVARRAGYRAVQSTPLMMAGGRPIGMVSTHFRQPRTLTDAECRLTDLLAGELSSALERISSEQILRDSERTLRRHRGWLDAQKAALQSARNGAPLETSLGILARAAVEASDGDRRCVFYIADASGTSLRHVVGMPESDARCVEDFQISSGSLASGLAVATGQLARDHHDRGCWSFPVETSTGKLVGSFAMYFAEPREPTPRDRELAAMLARTAAIIISRHHENDARSMAPVTAG